MLPSEVSKVTKKMVGSGNDVEADMPLMDIGASNTVLPFLQHWVS